MFGILTAHAPFIPSLMGGDARALYGAAGRLCLSALRRGLPSLNAYRPGPDHDRLSALGRRYGALRGITGSPRSTTGVIGCGVWGGGVGVPVAVAVGVNVGRPEFSSRR